MASVIVMGPIVITLGIVLAIMWPDIAVGPLMLIFLPLGLILPIVMYPMSYTMWQAADLVMRPVEPDHFDVSHLDE
jgi:hypothetical protein